MDRRDAAAAVAANVAFVGRDRGLSTDTLADAAGIRAASLSSSPFAPELTWGELLSAGGVLSVSPVEFFREVPGV